MASRRLGTAFQVAGTAATQTCRVAAWAAGATATTTRADPRTAVSPRLCSRRPRPRARAENIGLADLQLPAHPRVDGAEEVERRALGRRHLKGGGVLTGRDEGGVARRARVGERGVDLPGGAVGERRAVVDREDAG